MTVNVAPTDELHDETYSPVVAAIGTLTPDEHVPGGAALAEFVEVDVPSTKGTTRPLAATPPGRSGEPPGRP